MPTLTESSVAFLLYGAFLDGVLVLVLVLRIYGGALRARQR